MANSYSSSVTASQVGSYFVQQYYQVLQQQPEFVHQFYADSSTMVRVDGESTETASAIFQIHTLIQSLQFSGIEIKTINALESWSEGIVVVVSGSVRSKFFNGWRKFVQTFFLAPQEKGYFVMNDIFHFVSEEVIHHHHHHHQAPVALESKVDSQPISSTPSELLVADDTLEVEARENLNSLHLEGNNEDDYYNSQENQQQQEDYESEEEDEEEEEEEAAVEYVHHQKSSVEYVQEAYHHHNTAEVQEPVVEYVQEPVSAVEEPIVEPVKFTYASILRSKGKSSPSVPSHQPAVSRSVAPVPEWNQTPEPHIAQLPPSSSVSESNTQFSQEAFASEEGDSKSVYVRNLPTTVTSLEIFQEFKNFGKIKQDGVFLKNRKDVGVCFAFVEFEDLEGVQKAIEASPIQLAGRQVYIEERRANSSGGSRGGRGGRGGGRGRGDAAASSRGGGRYGGRGNGFR